MSDEGIVKSVTGGNIAEMQKELVKERQFSSPKIESSAGKTKPVLEKRVEQRRKNKKMVNQSKKRNRGN